MHLQGVERSIQRTSKPSFRKILPSQTLLVLTGGGGATKFREIIYCDEAADRTKTRRATNHQRLRPQPQRLPGGIQTFLQAFEDLRIFYKFFLLVF